MALQVVQANANDNDVRTSDANYATSRAGAALTLGNPSEYFITVGQRLNTGVYQAWEAFLEFPYTVDSTALRVSAFIRTRMSQNIGTVARELQFREQDWGGGAVTTTDYVPGATVGSLPFHAAVGNMQSWLQDDFAMAGGPSLITRMDTAGPLRLVLGTNRQAGGSPPTGDEYTQIWSQNAGAYSAPALTIGTIPKSTLAHVSAAACQLSDGTAVYLESNGAVPPAITLKYRTPAGAVGSIYVLTIGTGGFSGGPASLQRFSVVVDASDNLYVLGEANSPGGATNNVLGQGFLKSSGLTWTAKSPVLGNLPAYVSGGRPNQGVGAWHPTSGAGHIMYVGSHLSWTGATGTMFYAVLSCATLLAGSGSLIAASAADPAWFGIVSQNRYVAYPNESGSLLDITPVAVGSNTGFIVSANGDNQSTIGTYTLSTTGALASSAAVARQDLLTPHDPNGKVRAVAVGGGRVVFTNGYELVVRNAAGTLGGDWLAATNFPTGTAQQGSSSWDAVYDPSTSKVWIYYLDATDSRVLRRTGFSLISMDRIGDSVVVNSSVGATGTANVSIRAPRGFVDERRVQLAIANVAGAVLSTVYVDDSLNLAPNAPTAQPVGTFDATQAKTFSWTFSDANPKDTQAAYQLQIIRTSDSVSMFDTGQVTSTSSQATVPAGTLANSVAYQWRVRTWDPAGNAGAYSFFADFTPSGAGSVTITTPAVDNPGGQTSSDYAISWTTTGTVQAFARVQVIDTVAGTTFMDTGMVRTTATTGTVKALQSGREYRVQVTVRNESGIVSSPGTRLITPVYLSPEIPVVALAAMDTYIQVAVQNPDPTGSNPDVTVNRLYRRVVGASAWSLLADLPPNGSYRDYTVGANVPYEYIIRADAGVSSDIASISGPALLGVYLHDPDDPAGTIQQFFYAPSGKKESRAVEGEMMVFAGRARPVAEFGEIQTDTVAVEFLIPFDDQWSALVVKARKVYLATKTYVYRDGRGRSWYGSIRGITFTDTNTGTNVSFTFERTDYPLGEES